MNGMHESIKDQMNQFKQTRNNDQNDDSISAESEDADDVVQGIDPSILEGLSAADRADVIASLQKDKVSKNAEPVAEKVERDEFARLCEALAISSEDDTSFWKKNRSLYPNAYLVDLQVRCIRPSTARLESVFSIASRLVPDERSSTTNATLNMKLMLKTAKLKHIEIREAAKRMTDPGRPKKESKQE